MNLINEHYEPLVITSDAGLASRHIFYYSTEQKDFFCSSMFVWSAIRNSGYIVEIEGKTAIVPEHFFVVVGDYEVGLDSIQFAEIMGREFDVYTMNKAMDGDSALLRPMKIVGYVKSHVFYYPLFDYMFPIAVGDLAIVVSTKDMYNRLKRMTVYDLA